MGIFKNYFYSNSGTEIEFMQGLIDLICSLDDGITCEDEEGNPTTAQEQYADLSSAKTATFYINFGNGIRSYIIRGNTNNNNAQTMYFHNNGHSPTFANRSYGATVSAERSVHIAYYKGDDFIWFAIGHYYSQNITDLMHSFGLIKANNSRYVGFYDAPNTQILTVPFTDNNMTIAFTNLFPYSAGAGKIDYANKMPALSSGEKQFDVNSICPCSTVALYSSIALPDGRNFLAIGTNAMVELDAEDAS